MLVLIVEKLTQPHEGYHLLNKVVTAVVEYRVLSDFRDLIQEDRSQHLTVIAEY